MGVHDSARRGRSGHCTGLHKPWLRGAQDPRAQSPATILLLCDHEGPRCSVAPEMSSEHLL